MAPRSQGGDPAGAIPWPPIVVGAGAGAAFLAVVLGRFVAAERFIYFWDFSGYWTATIEMGRLLGRPQAALHALIESVRHDPYNLLAAVPLAPISHWFHDGRTAWVVTVLGVYGLPALIVLGGVGARLSSAARSTWASILAVSPLVLLPALWAPVAVGAVGIGGVAIGGAAWLWGAPPARGLSTRRALAVGGLLALMVVFRRWYAFWVAGWVVALAVDAMVAGPWVERVRGLGRVATVAATAAGLFLLLATPIAVQMLASAPAAELAAYRSERPYAQGLGLAVHQLGWIPLALAVVGAALAWRAPRTRPLARAMVVQLVVIVALFLRVQRFDRHHYYLVAPQVAVFAAVCVQWLGQRAREGVLARAALAMVLGVLSIGFAAAFYPPLGDRLHDPWALLATPRYRPQTRDDLASIERLCRTLDGLTHRSGSDIYVLSSDGVLNDDVLKNAHLTTAAPDLSARVVRSAHVDRRDRFPHGLLRADYVVLTDPPGLHLAPQEQEVITIPAEQILSGEGIGRSFRRRPEEFVLQGGVKAMIYERTTPLRPAAVRALRDRLEGAVRR